MYILFDNFKICFNIAISDVTKDSTHPGNNSPALSCQSLTRFPIADKIHFTVERLHDAALEQQIAGNQKLFHYLISNLRFLCSGEQQVARGDKNLIFIA